MTKVTFFVDFHCFEYQASHGARQRIHYYMHSQVYDLFPVTLSASTRWEYAREKTVFSSDFLPSRVFRELKLAVEEQTK